MLQKILRISPIIIVMNLSFCLLLYVGYGEAKRSYWKFKLDKLTAQSEIVRDLMDDFLKIGLPLTLIKDFLEKDTALGKFAGFSLFSDNQEGTQQTDIAVTVTNNEDVIVFASDTSPRRNPDQKRAGIEVSTREKTLFDYRNMDIRNAKYAIMESDQDYQMVLPLHDKFRQVGNLTVTISKAPNQNFLKSKFIPVLYITLSVCLFLSTLIIILDTLRVKKHFRTYLGSGYTMASLIMAVIIMTTLVTIYSHGAEDKIKALSKSLTQRLSAVTESNVDFNTISGLNTILKDYQQLDADIKTVALIENNIVRMHQDPGAIGRAWQSRSNEKEYAYQIKNSTASVMLTIDKRVIRNKILLAVKNLVTLIAACFFMGFLAFKIGTMLRNSHQEKACKDDKNRSQCAFTRSLYETMMPVWFLIVFAEALSLSFLPKYLNDICTVAQASPLSGSLLFSAFFAGFALILLPSGYLADKWNEKYLILAGIMLFASAMVLMGTTTNYYTLLAVRFAAGVAQGIVFIGVQNYIQKVSQKDKLTQGGAVIVFSFNGGIISGSAIGSILLVDMGIRGIFFSSALISIAAFCFTLFYVPGIRIDREHNQPTEKLHNLRHLWNKTRTIIGDGEFLRTLILVGATSKAVYTGITIYTVPLLMSRFNFTQEDIGLALMVYAGSVLLSNYYVSKWADKVGNIPIALFWGVLISSLGIIVISLIGWKPLLNLFAYSAAVIFFGGMLLLGIANGAISSPVVSHIMDTRVCHVLGKGQATAIYRLLERIGHIVGPIIVGHLMMQNYENMNTLLLLGITISVFGFFFLIVNYRNKHRYEAGKDFRTEYLPGK